MSSLKHKLVRFLRWSEQYTKTDMVYLAHGGFWLTLGYVLQVISGLVLSVAFANLLPKESFGTYQFVVSMASIVGAFTLTGMGSAIKRATARGSDDALSQGFRVQLAWSTGIVLAAGALAAYYYIQNNALLAVSFLVVGACQPFIAGLSMYKWFLIGKRLFRENFFLETAHKLIPFVALLPALYLTNDPLTIIAVYFVSHALAALYAYVTTVRRYTSQSTSVEPELTQYSKHLSVMITLDTIAANVDKVLIWTVLGAAPVAIYTLAQMPVIHMQSMFGMIRQIAFPKLVEKPFHELQEILLGKIQRYMLVALCAVGIYVVVAPHLFALFFPAYMESVAYSQVLSLLVLMVPRWLISESFLAHQMKKELYALHVSTPMVRVGSLAAFLPIYGIWGVVAAVLIAELYAAILQVYLFRKARE
jgi:O-antigen/teichoic acid export membrane protein